MLRAFTRAAAVATARRPPSRWHGKEGAFDRQDGISLCHIFYGETEMETAKVFWSWALPGGAAAEGVPVRDGGGHVFADTARR